MPDRATGSHPARLARQFVLATLVAMLALVSVAQIPAAAAAADCQFTAGFKTLHDLIPNVVGNCVANERYDPKTGDGLQPTTHGLLVWRKSDNSTAFTNGYRTWIEGPDGLQVRANNARFRWEPDVAPANVDPALSAAYHLAAASHFGNLIAYVVAQGIPVRLAALPTNVYGAFTTGAESGPGGEAIFVDQSLADANPNDAATVLIHESTHAYDFTHEPNFSTPAGCFQTELHAKTNGLTFWRDQFGPNGKQPAVNAFERSENAELALAQVDLRALLRRTFEAYQSECGL